MIHALQNRDEGQNEEHAEHARHEPVAQEGAHAEREQPLRTLHDPHPALHTQTLGARARVGDEKGENEDREGENSQRGPVGVSPLGASLERAAHPDGRGMAAGEVVIGEPHVEGALAHPVQRGVQEGAEGAHHPALARHVAVEDVAQPRQREHEPRGEKGSSSQEERREEGKRDAQDRQVIRHDASGREITADGPEELASLVLPVSVQSPSSSFPSRGAPPTTSTNSPRGGVDSAHSSNERRVPRRVSSNFLVSSREIEAGRSPQASARSRKLSRSRCGDSKKMRVRGSRRNSSMRARRRAARRGRNPSKANRSVGSPETSRAQSALEAPGIGTTGTPASTAARTSVKAGSEIPGEPASETMATEAPSLSFPTRSGVRRSLLWS